LSYVIWHNPRCSKSRAALAILEEAGVDVTVRRYRDDPPTADEIDRVLLALGVAPDAIVRLGEPVARELDLENARLPRDAWLRLMAENPILIERPIVIGPDGAAILGRPPENVRNLL
jgi:arsenate reductase